MFNPRYIDPTTDFGFKRLFGQEDSKEILKHFLYHTLALAHPIKELSYLPTEQLPDFMGERSSIYDLYCVDEAEQHFIVEMQKNPRSHFKERALYYSTFPITRQLRRGNTLPLFRLPPIYCLSILDFRLDKAEAYLRRVQLADTADGQIFYDKLTFVFIELPKFNLPLTALTTATDKWIYLLKNMPELLDIPQELAALPYTAAFQIAEQAKLSPQEREVYLANWLKELDELDAIEGNRLVAMEDGLARGLAQGRAEGHAEGELEKARTIARALLAKGLDKALVMEATHLSVVELDELIASL